MNGVKIPIKIKNFYNLKLKIINKENKPKVNKIKAKKII